MERRRAEELMRLEDMDRNMQRERAVAASAHGRGFDQGGTGMSHAALMDMGHRVHQSWVGDGNVFGHHVHGMHVQHAGGYGEMQMHGGGQHRYDGPMPRSHRHHQEARGDFRGRRVAVVSGRGGGSGTKPDSVRGGAKGDSRSSAFNRLGPKMPVKARLGGSKSSAADR